MKLSRLHIIFSLVFFIQISSISLGCKSHKTVDVTRARKKSIFYNPEKKKTNKPPKRIKKVKMRVK